RPVFVFLIALTTGAVFAGGSPQAQAPKEPGTAVLTGSARGAVTLHHKAHTTTPGAKSDAGHPPAKAQKRQKTPHEKYGNRPTKSATPPMTTKLQAAFHDPMTKKGTCVDCHQDAIAKGSKKAPVKCADCHKKA